VKLILPARMRKKVPFYDMEFGIASDFPEHLRNSPGQRPTQPVFAAKWRMDAPYPDVQHVLPVRPEAIRAYQQGDAGVLVALAQELIEAHQRFLVGLRAP